MRPDAGRRRRRRRARRLGGRSGERRRARRRGRRRLRSQPPLRRGRADDRADHALDAGDGRREPHLREPRLLHPQRGARQGDALRRQRRRGAGPPRAGCADDFGPALGAALREAGEGIALKPLVARGLWPWATRCTSATSPAPSLLLRERGAGPGKNVVGDGEALATAVRLHRRQRPVLPQRRHGLGQGRSWTRSAASRSSAAWSPPCAATAPMFGIRVSGHRRHAGSPRRSRCREGLYFPGYSAADANPDMGDSTIVETVGLGGFAMGASPAVAGFVGAGARRPRRLDFTRRHAGDHGRPRTRSGPSRPWTTQACPDRHRHPPGGRDRPGRRPSTPASPTSEPGIGQVGAGVVRAPMACFEQALEAFAAEMGVA